MKYAVVKIQGTQYKLSEGEEVLVDTLGDKELKSDTLLLVDDEKVEVGTPTLEKVKVTFDILGEEKGEKIVVGKYKAKSRYRKRIGFRPKLTKLRVKKIA